MKKKLLSMFLIVVFVVNLLCTAYGAVLSDDGLVSTDENKVTISGTTKYPDGDDVIITILNQGKTLADMASITTGEEYINTIKKQITTVAQNGKYSVTFDFEFTGDEKYVTVISNQAETKVYYLSADGLTKSGLVITHIEYEESEVHISGYSPFALSTVEYDVLNPGKTEEDYLNDKTTSVYTSGETKTDENGNFEIELSNLPYTQSEGCLIAFNSNEDGEMYKLIKPAEIHISATGDIKTAMENALKEAHTNYPEVPVDIIIPAGEYRVTQSIVLNNAYSRAVDAPITFKADGKVIINGSKKIDISLFNKVTAKDSIYSRLSESVKDEMLKLDLNGLVPDDVTNITTSFISTQAKGRGVQQAAIFLNDKKQSLAKYPNSGYSEQINPEGGDTKAFYVSDADKVRMKGWADAEDIIVDGFWKYSWYSMAVPVESLDRENGKINVKWEPHHPIGSHYADIPIRYRVFNLPEEIDAPGEWYMDEENKILYYYAGRKLTDSDVFEIAVLGTSIIKCEADNIIFDGLEICKNYTKDSTSGEGVSIKGEGIVVKNSIVRDVGTIGISAKNTSKKFKADSCVVYNTGTSGISIMPPVDQTENRKNLRTMGHIIENCDVSDTGLIRAGNIGAVESYATGSILKNNRIHNILSNGIVWHAPENLIKNNELYLVTTNMCDTAAIYSGRSWAYYGTKINDNLIHNYGCSKYMGVGDSGNWGIYHDDTLGGATAERNIIISDGRETTEGIYISHGPDHTFDSNIIINTKNPIFHLWNGKLNMIRRFDAVYDFGYDSPYMLKNLNLAERVKLFENAILEKGYTVQQIREELAKYDNNEEYDSSIISALQDVSYQIYDENNVITNNVAYNAYSSSTEFYNKEGGISGWVDSPGKTTGILMFKETWMENTDENNKFVTKDAFIQSEPLDFRVKSEYKTANSLGANVPDENTLLSSYGIQDFTTVNKVDKSFNVTMPNNNSFVNEGKLQLAWEQSALADGYKYQIATDDAFANIVEEGETSYTNIVTATNLAKGNTYYLKVTALDKSRDGLKNNKSVNAPVVMFTVSNESDYTYTFASKPEIYYDSILIDNTNIAQYSEKDVDLKDYVTLPTGKNVMDLCYIIAIYEGKSLKGVKVADYTIKGLAQEEEIIVENIRLPEIKAGYTFKILRWNSLTNLKPIPDVYKDKSLMQ